MSSDTQDRTHDEGHEGPIKTTGQLIWVVVLSFVVPIVLILLLVNFVVVGDRPAAGTEAFSERAIAQRLLPAATVELQLGGGAAVVRSGQQVYSAACMACHAAGVAGAPKSGDLAAWAPRIRTGFEALLNSTLKGKGAMPPQGGGQFSDHELALAVVHMANQAGGNFPEPPAPAAAAPAEAAAR
jgi:cytochrome c5